MFCAIAVLIFVMSIGGVLLISIEIFKFRADPPIGGTNHADSAFFMDVQQNLLDGKGFNTQYGASVIANLRQIAAFDGGIISALTFADSESPLNSFRHHAYPILWPQAILSKIFGLLPTQAFLMTLTWLVPVAVSLMVTAYLARRYVSQRMALGSLVSAIALFFTIIQFPGVTFSAIGQYYPDRLFLAVFPVHMIVAASRGLGESRSRMAMLVVTGLLLLAISERSAMYLALVSLFLWSERRAPRILHFMSFAVSAIWIFIYLGAITTNTDSTGYVQQLLNPDLNFVVQQLKLSLNLLLFSLPVALICVRNFKYLLFLFVAVAPNVLGTVGGGEKSGWMTHYLTYWSGFLIGLTLYSVLSLNVETQRTDRRLTRFVIPVVALIASSIVNFTLNPFNLDSFSSPDKSNTTVTYYARRSFFNDSQLLDSLEYGRDHRSQVVSVLSELPKGASISASYDYAFDSVLSGLDTRLYPIGVLQTDYVVFNGDVSDGKIAPVQSTVYLGGATSTRLNDYLTNILNSQLFEIERYDPRFHLVLLRRQPSHIP